jgi:hypothetical protein|tara:strand:- start:4328 stop:5356 length:1029 start_codon:yes stop_codon:yes gene_type:complete
MAYTTVPKSTDYFNTKLYTGNAGTQTITGVDFQPDWTWIKNRVAAEHHVLTDAVRGANKQLNTNRNNAELSLTTQLTAFTSDGFSVGAGAEVNGNGNNMVSWNWKANGQGSSNTDGTINSTYTSVNTTSGFSIVEFTASGSGGTVGHGLGVAPKAIIFKRLDAASDWAVYHASLGNVNMCFLNTTTAASSNASILNSTSPTSSVFTVGSSNIVTGGPVIAYCFADVQGYSKMGSYTGNGNANGPFIYTGFKPTWLMIRATDIGGGTDWYVFDNKRPAYNLTNLELQPNNSGIESSDIQLDILSNGFKPKGPQGGHNGNGNNYIYMAFGQPIVSTNGDIATAR